MANPRDLRVIITTGVLSPAAYVHEFHKTYDCAIRDVPVANPPEDLLRLSLLEEEVKEYADALGEKDIVEIADALADIVYVAYGAALTHGIDLDAILAEVHRSNMSKLAEDGSVVRRGDGKVLKGPNYSPPDIASVLGVL